ncbi:MAG TPA: hypothetical protein GXX46_00670 [Peptococcaceae bacterium]|nr:hypothetical protein [Peptococcaceae bacterium]
MMNRKVFFFYLIFIFLLGLTLLTLGYTRHHPTAVKTAFKNWGQTQAESASSESLKLSEISFSLKNLPPMFEIVVGGKTLQPQASSGSERLDGSSDVVRLDQILGKSAFLPDSFWLVSPFYEPQEFSFKDFNLSEPIDLGSLALTMQEKKITIHSLSEFIQQTGPFICGRDDAYNGESLYAWAGPDTLWCFARPQGVKLISFKNAETISQPIINFYNETSLALSPDGLKIAYIEQGYLVVHNLQTGKSQKWPLTKNPSEQTFATCSTELLSWSPNGRFILGSNFAYYNHYLAKLWVLDLQTGRISPFNARLTHSFLDPVWSPDGNQAVVREVFKPFSDDFRGQWNLLDMRSQRIYALAPKEKFNTHYDFTWSRSSKRQVVPRLANKFEFIDPLLRQEQNEFRAYRLDSGARFQATSLNFLSDDGATEFTLDLKPALVKCGLELDSIHTLFFEAFKTTDNKYLFLHGKAATPNSVRAYALYGRVDLTTKEAVFLKPFWSKPESRAILLSGRLLSVNNQALLLPEEDSCYVFDLNSLTCHELEVSEPLLCAGWLEDKIFYITENGIYLQVGENTRILHKAKDNEHFLPGIKLSPDLSYAVVPSKKPYTGMLDELNLLIINLKGLEGL